MGKKKTDEYNEGYDLFCNTDLNQKEIAKVIAVSEAHLSKWIKENDWELDKVAQKVTVEKIIRDLYRQISAINKLAQTEKRIFEPGETDSIIKITNSIEKLRKKHNLSAYHAVLRECLNWMMKADNEKAKVFGPIMLEFLKEKAQKLTNDTNIG